VLKAGCTGSMLVWLLIVVRKSSLADEVAFPVDARNCAVSMMWESSCIAAIDHTLKAMAALRLVKVEDNVVVSSRFLRRPFLVKLEESQTRHSHKGLPVKRAFTYLPVRTRCLDGASEDMDEVGCRHTQDVKSPRAQKSWKQGRTVHAGHSMVHQKLAKKCMVKRGSEYRFEQTLEVML